MSESTQSTRSHKDPVRIVYHAGNRTFARLFNERSLEEVKDIVRRKLGLGADTDVSLKQMGPGALLDLEDDADFQAFRVFLKSFASMDIEVTVGKSQGHTVPPPVAQPREPPSASKPTKTTSVASPSKEPVVAATLDQPSVHPQLNRTTEASPTLPRKHLASAPKRHPAPLSSSGHGGIAVSDVPMEQCSDQSGVRPEVARTTEASSTPANTPLVRKRKVPSDHGNIAASDQPIEQSAPAQPTDTPAVAPAKTAESPVSTKEPPKKKLKKGSTNKKEVQASDTAESPATKPLALKTKSKRSLPSDRGSKAGTSAAKDAETSEPPAKKQKKQKKDNSTAPKDFNAILDSLSVDKNGMDQPISQGNNPANKAPLQPAVEKPGRLSVGGSTLKTRKSEKTKTVTEGVCATIPQTSASACVQSEVAAAILSCLSEASETVAPEPPAKRKSVKSGIKKSAASPSALLREPTTILDAPANEISNTPDLNGPLCPICLGEPFHIRYYCPTVLKGPDAIRERLEELKLANMGYQRSLIKQLERLLRDSEVISKPSLGGAGTDRAQSSKISLPLNVPLPRSPNIPNNSYLSGVTVESRDEGSSSESSDDMSEGGVEPQELSTTPRQQRPDEQLVPSNGDLELIIRGPTAKRRSILNLLDRIIGDEGDEGSGMEEDDAKLEEDLDEETGRSRRQSSRHITRSSDSESDEEDSRSPSPSRSAENTLTNPGPDVQSSNKSTGELADHQEGDVLMTDSVDLPVPKDQHYHSSKDTHVGSEDRMIVDESTGEKGAAIVAEEQPSSPVPRTSVLQSSDAPSNDPQESAKTRVDPTPNHDGSIPVASEVLKEVEADPIEPADDLVPPTGPGLSNPDPIEALSDDIGSLFGSVTQLAPKPGVSKRIKTRDGEILDKEEHPVLLEQLASGATNEVTPVPVREKSRRKVAETPASQGATSTRKSPRFSSVPPSTSTPAAVALLNRQSKTGARTGKATKTPVKVSEERSDALKSSSKDDTVHNGANIAPTLPLIRWETLAEPSSPSLQLDESLLLIDELMSSPQPNDTLVRGRLNNKVKKGRTGKAAICSQAESSQGKERLSDPSSSQIPLPAPNGENERMTDSEEEPKVAKKKTKLPVRYRSLSQLASQATLFSPSFPTPVNRSMTNGKAKKRTADEDSSSSSSSEDEANGSEHIPQGRRAGSALETKKTLLSRI